MHVNKLGVQFLLSTLDIAPLLLLTYASGATPLGWFEGNTVFAFHCRSSGLWPKAQVHGYLRTHSSSDSGSSNPQTHPALPWHPRWSQEAESFPHQLNPTVLPVKGSPEEGRAAGLTQCLRVAVFHWKMWPIFKTEKSVIFILSDLHLHSNI